MSHNLAVVCDFWRYGGAISIHANISVIPKTISLDFDTELTKDPYNWKISQKFLLQFFLGKASIFGSLTLLYDFVHYFFHIVNVKPLKENFGKVLYFL